MLTGMTEGDWAIALAVFDAAQSRSGEPGRDDRKFFEAMHFFTVHNLTWRALPAEYGHWNSVWKLFWWLSRLGVFKSFFPVARRNQPNSTFGADVRQHRGAGACLSGGRKREQQNQALGRSHGWFSCKIHLKTDWDGLPIGFHLTGGEVSDSTQLATSLDIGPDITPRAALTDKGYDAKTNRAACRERGIVPVIPHRANAKNRPTFFPKTLYKGRARIEQAMGKLKRFKRVAFRCEKTAESYAAFVAFACSMILVKSVHTT